MPVGHGKDDEFTTRCRSRWDTDSHRHVSSHDSSRRFAAILVVLWLLYLELTGNGSRWKRVLGRRLKFDPTELVYHEAFLAWLKEQKATGREMILCTASEEFVAKKIAEHVGLFDDVMASDGVTNLRMEAKGKALAERYGKGNFAYAGNSSHDLKTWPYAGEVIVVNASKSTLNALGDQPSIVFE